MEKLGRLVSVLRTRQGRTIVAAGNMCPQRKTLSFNIATTSGVHTYNKMANYLESAIVTVISMQESKSSHAMYFDDDDAKEMFSVYEFRYPCSEPAGYCIYKTMIEPLAFGLRHPAALCKETFPLRAFNAISVLDHDYLFFATKEQTRFGPKEHTHVDLGAHIRSNDHMVRMLCFLAV